MQALPVRDPAAGAARRRRREGRAPDTASRAAARSPAWSIPRAASSARPTCATTSTSAASAVDLKTARGPRAVARARAALRRDRRELQAGHDGPHGPRLRGHRAPRTRRSIYVSISGFGNQRIARTPTGPRTRRSSSRCRASTTTCSGDEPPRHDPGRRARRHQLRLFGVIGILAALRHRDRTGVGQYVDIAMFDATVAMTDIVTNFWSLGDVPARRAAERDPATVPRVRRLRRRCRSCASTSSSRSRRARRPPRVEGRPTLRRRARVGPRTSRT